ncbi:MAG TPA: RdgB/HAM1 family non-canonical purine NTP pyrophosphatase [Candidatus Levybacteria bacterium]|nr:RdgB/HAM1 family non-canonical purine NTP pyrophosphatase [Candidatus Levybacteria bacterium]
MNSLVFVTGNKNKVKEAQSILEIPIEIADIDVQEIQDLDVEKVVHKKAESAYQIVKKPLIVDDAGLYIEAWNGFPGALVKHLHVSNGLETINKWLSLEKNRKVRIVAAIGYHDGNKVFIFTGEIAGTFVEPRGDKGWGFDSFILPEGYDKTWGEMESYEKNAMSHRRQALEKFKEYLNKVKK